MLPWCTGLWRQLEINGRALQCPCESHQTLVLNYLYALAVPIKISKWMGVQTETYIKIPPEAFEGLCLNEQLHRLIFQ